MTNGQLNVVSVPVLMQPATQEPTAPAAMMPDAAQQDGGGFAGLLNEIQSLAKLKTATDSGGAEQPLAWIGEEPFPRDPGAEIQAVDLLALFTVSPQAISASDPAAPKPEEPEKTGAGPQDNEPSDVAGQMVVAAYMQPGRIPEVNIPTPRSADMFRNGAAAAEQSAVKAVLSVGKQTVHPTADPLPAVADQAAEMMAAKPSVSSAEGAQQRRQPESVLFAPAAGALRHAETEQASPGTVQPVLPGRMPVDVTPEPLPVGRLQNGAPVPSHPAVNVAPPVDKQAEHVTAEHFTPAPVLSGEFRPAEIDRMSNVNKPAQPPVDRQQNVATGSGQPALFSVPTELSKVVQTAPGPVQTPAALSMLSTPLPASDESLVPSGTMPADLSGLPTEKTAAALRPHSGLPVADLTAPVLDAAAESEIETLIAQPRPINALTAVAAVSNENSTAPQASEQHGSLQRITPEPQIDRVRGGNEQRVVKELAPPLQATASAGESMPGSETSHGSSFQEFPDTASDNQMQQQQMNGQLQADHQRGATPSAKAVSAEPIRQDIPEQVMQQVKERLVQHEVKPGNQQITLTLSPDTLGELKMNLNLQGQKLSVEIVTESRAVRDAIVQHTDALKESLARQNITMESFDVTTGGKGAGNQGQNQNAWRELAKQQNQQQSWASPRGYHTAQYDIPSIPPYQRDQGQSMLDIHY